MTAEEPPTQSVYEFSSLNERRRLSGEPWMEFLRVRSLSMGIYVLAAGADDLQEPHTEDEVYYIVGGAGFLRVGEEDRPVSPGSLLFVPAEAVHRFHGITKELTALVFFAPAEGTRSKAARS